MAKVLDKGYVEFVESWGSEERIIEAARMSTNKGFVNWDEDAKLLAYLYNHKHMTPFEMAGMVLEVKAPIMVFREWHRHRTMSYNEMSARYVPLPNDDYLPTIERLMLGANTATTNKQAQGLGTELSEHDAMDWLYMLEDVYNHCQIVYECGLKLGIPKELARLPVTVGRYSRMRVSCNLRNWLAFLTLRQDSAAQYEIRVYADEVCKLIAEHFPRTEALFSKSAQ
ncbi:THY1 Predicted alternative thymidylate synthase [uncultured Caudovirales phage]|uniref:THY1 Predicted alternative thymidylate synthase n=1 Tax=uncultured Caudovirales phage TaxID=2100421 RepID=A0A6J5PD63_9CAUD|nr:THY1 Predicted alternative thymidylate synthase [uncultured Caudovirales phage]CAB5226968.1 THY1 Predicted alternative thymidylate synthase [uncultured Caudovirales phage]